MSFSPSSPSTAEVSSPIAVLTAWVASQQLASPVHARVHLSPPLNTTGMQLILDVLRLNKYPEEQWKAILATRVVAKRKTSDNATLSLQEWTMEKCLKQLKSLDQSFWVPQERGEGSCGQLGDDEQQQQGDEGLQTALNHDHVSLLGEETRRIPRKTQTPGSFHDFDWGESDESEEEEDLF
jgi:hypothetical protein